MFPRNYMSIFICKLDPQNSNTQKHKENPGGGLQPLPQRGGPPRLLDCPCVSVYLGFGVEFTYKNRHIISGKHAQELYVDFDMLPTEGGIFDATVQNLTILENWLHFSIFDQKSKSVK